MQTSYTPGFENLFNLGRNLFATILLRDSQDAEGWAKRAETFSRHGLLSFLTEALFKPQEIEVDHSKLSDARYRRQLIRKLKAPRPGKHRHVKLVIDRERLHHDEVYLHQMAAVLAYKWTQKTDTEDAYARLLLQKQDVETLTLCLDRMGMHQSTPEAVGARVLRTHAERALDESEALRNCLTALRADIAPIKEAFALEVQTYVAEALAQSKASINEIAEAAAERFDALREVVAADFAAQAAQTQAVLDECAPSGLDPQEEFRMSVMRREREWKEQNKLSRKAKLLWTAVAMAVTGFIAKFVEFDGLTILEALP